MNYKPSIDPYMAMLKQSERRAMGYGVLALLLLVMTFIVTGFSSEGTRQFSSVVKEVQHMVGFGILCGSGVSALTSIWFVGRYVYLFKWPERFD